MHKRRPPKPISFFERAVPASEKYAHVQATLDTGYTVDKVKVVNAKEISKRRGEVFYRIGKNSLHDLYQEYEDEHHESFTSAISPGSDGGPRIMTYEEEEKPKYDRPYLILDVRDALDYNKGHLLQSRSYPYTMMRRDYTHPELYHFKNKEGCLIIMYCDDEKISQDAAFLLVQRGCDNVYLLTGGLFEFASFYRSFVEGEVSLPKASPSRPPRTMRSSASNLTSIREEAAASTPMSRASSQRPVPQSLTRSNLIGRGRFHDDKSESGMSTNSNMSVADSVISRAMSRKGKM